MRIQLRSDGEPTCEHCGSTELIHEAMTLNGWHDTFLQEENKAAQEHLATLTAALDQAKALYQEAADQADLAYTQAVRNAAAEYGDNTLRIINACYDALDTPGWRFLKRRWATRTALKIHEATHQLERASRK